MPGPILDKPAESSSPRAHIELVDDNHSPRGSNGQPSPGLRNSKGWDGKLRIDRTPRIENPEALSDPEYSDDENVLKGEDIKPDEDLLEDEETDVEEIILTHSRIGSVSALRLDRFQQCERLCLRQNSIQTIEGLEGLCACLKDLDLYDNLISHMKGLESLTKLTSLDLSFNKIKHIKRVNHLAELTDIFFVANKISTIENLEGLDKLRNLELGSNRIREIENLQCLKALEELWLAKNKITSLDGLGGLPNLRLLSIQSNRIRDLSPLSVVPTLEELYISHNALESLEGLEGNKKLKILDISNNQVTSLKGLGGLEELEEVWASYNQLADFNDIETHLADKKELNTVYFEGNPLQLRGPTLYRNKVRLALPQVRQIDASMFFFPVPIQRAACLPAYNIPISCSYTPIARLAQLMHEQGVRPSVAHDAYTNATL
ncbi:hypothetical protein MKZ38_008381 [Zalerion maritima]|uniref:Protein phosphatase 1 regulatory subunit 7 n=1 Tax=Zalerion maritima TaxID=339359 RepID=A0AAD5RHJ7_9PEZI|nr:hypothetical protein MKZ38_008381 [Zalerion maritima]